MSLVQWILGAVWTVALLIGGWIVKIFSDLRKKLAALELKVTKVEAEMSAVDEKVDERHRENKGDLAEFRAYMAEEMRYLRSRLDRLLERSGGPG